MNASNASLLQIVPIILFAIGIINAFSVIISFKMSVLPTMKFVLIINVKNVSLIRTVRTTKDVISHTNVQLIVKVILIAVTIKTIRSAIIRNIVLNA